MGLIKHICKFCGKEYEDYFKDSKYCSKECYKSYRTENAKLKSQIDQYTQICNQLESMRQNYETVKKQCDTEMEDIDKEIALVQNALNQ